MNDEKLKAVNDCSWFINPESQINDIVETETKVEKKAKKVKGEKVVIEKNAETFLSLYFANLAKAKAKYPEQNNWLEKDILEVFRAMSESLRNGTYDRFHYALKQTCKDIGIKNSREEIDNIFKNEGKK